MSDGITEAYKCCREITDKDINNARREAKGENIMELTFRIDKECKHSRRYEADDPKAPIKTIYVERGYADGKDKIILALLDKED